MHNTHQIDSVHKVNKVDEVHQVMVASRRLAGLVILGTLELVGLVFVVCYETC